MPLAEITSDACTKIFKRFQNFAELVLAILSECVHVCVVCY